MLSKRLVALYEVGPTGYLEVLMGSTDFSDFLSRFDFLKSLVAQDITLLQSIKAQRQQYLATRAELEAQQNKLASLKGQKEDKRVQVASRAQDRELYLVKLQKERQAYEDALDELEGLSEELVKTIQEMQKSSTVNVTGTLAFAWPVVGRVTSAFGRRVHPVLRKVRNHTGIDIAVKSGTFVKASEAGIVLSSGWLGGYGKCVIIDNGKGYSTLYAHNSTLLSLVGQAVKKGQVIAYSGSTGLSTGPHVHFELRIKGAPQDPTKYLK
jgi:murein DD-endopeptidase MepM/ murein hydrolase activator NlpD